MSASDMSEYQKGILKCCQQCCTHLLCAEVGTLADSLTGTRDSTRNCTKTLRCESPVRGQSRVVGVCKEIMEPQASIRSRAAWYRCCANSQHTVSSVLRCPYT